MTVAESFVLQFLIWILGVHVVAACWVWVWSQSVETPHSLMEVRSGWFVSWLCFHTRQPWIFTACLSGDNNDGLRPSSCQMSVLWGFACLTRVTLIFDSSVASLLPSGHLLHAEDHMPFATAQREKPPQRRGCIQNPGLKSPFQWQTLVTSYFYMCGDVQRTVAAQYNEEKALTCASKLLIC